MNAWHLSFLFPTHAANHLKMMMQSQGFCMSWFLPSVCVCPCPYPCSFPSNLPCKPHSLASNRTLSFPWGCGCSSWLCNRYPYLCNLGKVSGSRSLPGPPGPHRSDSNPLGNLSSSPSVGIHHSTSWWNRCRVHCAGVSHCWALAGSSEIITWNEKAWSFILLSNPAAQFKNHCDLCIYLSISFYIYLPPGRFFCCLIYKIILLSPGLFNKSLYVKKSVSGPSLAFPVIRVNTIEQKWLMTKVV